MIYFHFLLLHLGFVKNSKVYGTRCLGLEIQLFVSHLVALQRNHILHVPASLRPFLRYVLPASLISFSLSSVPCVPVHVWVSRLGHGMRPLG